MNSLSPESYGTDLGLYVSKRYKSNLTIKVSSFGFTSVNDEITVSYLPPYIARVHINKPLRTQGGEPIINQNEISGQKVYRLE